MKNKLKKKYNLYMFFRYKKNGFVMLAVMFLIASITLIVVSVIVKSYFARNLSVIMSNNNQQCILLSNAISIVRSSLAGNMDKELKSHKLLGSNKNENIENKNNKAEENKKKEEKENGIDLFKFYWLYCNKWYKFEFIDEKEDFSGTIYFNIQAESGKIPLKRIYSNFLKEKEKNKNKDQAISSNNDKNNNDKNSNNSKFIEEINKFFNKFAEKFIFLKNPEDKNKVEGDGKNSFIYSWIKEYEKLELKISPDSLWSLMGPLSENKDLYNFSKIIQLKDSSLNKEDINKKIKEENKIGDIFSVYNEKCSLWYISPQILEFLSKKNKIELDDKIINEIIENGSNLMKNNRYPDVKSIFENVFSKSIKVPFEEEIFKQKNISDLFCVDDIPNIFIALIVVEKNKTLMPAVVVFEKISSFGKNNREYLVKQIYLLPKY
jgi:hypothetical protein